MDVEHTESISGNAVVSDSVVSGNPGVCEDIEQLAQEVYRRQLGSVALFFLEAHRPLRGMFYQLLIVSTPLFVPFFGAGKVESLLRIMEDDASLEKLIRRIEELSSS
ncbi:MAG: hypothetical protein KDD70_11635 [Bdellovibrionales bacterium]|nr:hypothetical protein [Bdellovibrionales bacterium]